MSVPEELLAPATTFNDIWRPIFKAFPKIPRYRRNFIITEKIDGTNACVIVGPHGTVRAQSRTRLITPENDNFGFAAWVRENKEELYEGLGEGYHYGEWFGGKIQRGYGLQEKRFALFNTGRWKSADHDTTDSGEFAPECCHVVPVLAAHHENLDGLIEACLSQLRQYGSAAVPGFMQPEGIVVYHTASGGYFKVLLENDEIPKSVQ